MAFETLGVLCCFAMQQYGCIARVPSPPRLARKNSQPLQPIKNGKAGVFLSMNDNEATGKKFALLWYFDRFVQVKY